MEAVGATAAIADLLKLSIKASKAAKSLVQSIIHAPEELVELMAKLDRLHSRINLLQNLSQELSTSNSTILFPPEYNTLFSVGLQLNCETLENIKSLWDPPTETERHIRKRLRWVTLDKKNATRILQSIKEAESELDFMLNILGTRLLSVNQTSLATLVANQAALRSTFRSSIKDIQTTIREELASLHNSQNVAPYHFHPRSASGAKDIITEYDSDIISNAMEYEGNRTLCDYSQTWGSFHNPQRNTDKTTSMGTSISFQSKRNRRKLRISLNAKFYFLCVRILQFEIRAQHISRQWLGGTWIGCSMTIFNLRPRKSPIFEACLDLDYLRTRDLLESGQASVYDVDDEYGGLLEHVLYGNPIENGHFVCGGPRLLRVKRLVRYLLEQGCDPSAFPGKVKDGILPAILRAFESINLEIISLMESYGADLLQFDSTPAGLFGSIFGLSPKEGFSQRVQKLRSIGFSDWKINFPSSGYNLLYGASGTSNLEEVLFALEVAGLSPNEGSCRSWTPTGNAAYNHWLEGVAVFIEFGTDINALKDVPLVRNTECGRINKTTHYLLYSGADPNLSDSAAHNAWHNIWDVVFELYGYQSQSWSFMQLEGTLAHMLLHNADPFTSFVTDPDHLEDGYGDQGRWYDSVTKICASEVARAWSYRINYDDHWYVHECMWFPSKAGTGFKSHFEELEETRSLEYASRWSAQGIIYPPSPENSHESAVEEGDSAHWKFYTEKFQSSGEDKLDPEFFQNATSFYRHINTAEGRKQLSRFPVVRALCDALQYAGYRAQMDDDGDIWYDCDDGDRYYDAREYQPDEEAKNWRAEFCPMCQRPEWYHLKNKEVEKEAKLVLAEYREKIKGAGRRFFY